MKKYFIFAAAAAMFAACSSDDGLTSQTTDKQETAQVPVDFGVYVNRGTTRAGQSGVINNATTLQTPGFGVFAYYTDGKPYSETSTPDFMYNQQVSGSGWTYSPLKYWPNEFGQTAISDNQDRLTFFAYAPWVDVTPGTGRLKDAANDDWGIVGLTTNTTTGDPYVKYYVSFVPTTSVDLLWGVAAADDKPVSVDNTNAKNKITAGSPYIDIFKPGASGADTKVKFDFKHALAKLNVQIDADVDVNDHTHSIGVDGKTRIWVRSVTFEGFTDKGNLNLNSIAPTPDWYDICANTKIGSGSVTIYDGRRDGKEGRTNAVASNETTLGLNSVLIQNEPYAASPYTTLALSTTTTTGVTNTSVNLFASATPADPVFVIPTGDSFKITIVYDVETSDENLAKYLSDGVVKGSTIENCITKEINFGSGSLALEAGKAYNVKLHLGMTSVKFDAKVTAWDTGYIDINTDLPVNGDVAP